MDICGKPALQRVIERLRAAKKLDDVIVATTTNAADDAIISLCDELNCNHYRGSEEDVLSRVLETARAFDVDVIVEITADCPLIDWNHVDALVEMHINSDCDMTSNIVERSFPRGYDIRVFNREALERVNQECDNAIDRQHVSTWMYLNPKGKANYTVQNWKAPPDQNRPDLDITLDTPEDLELIKWLYSFEKQGYNLSNGLDCREVINLIDHYPGQYEKVARVQRKDYFIELFEVCGCGSVFALQNMEWADDPHGNGTIEAIANIEQAVLNGTPTKKAKPVGILNKPKGAKKQDEPKKRVRKKKI
ncbi:MAG: NTP transferase domain-containing protein [Candidatus Omnitrophota bacterium]